MIEGNAEGALARVPEATGAAMYRGWMLKPHQYEAMHGALLARGVTLLNTPTAYRTCHYLRDGYRWIEGRTPRSVWIPVNGSIDFDVLDRSIASFGSGPLIVKDHVKSQKHYWNEACFIPSASDAASGSPSSTESCGRYWVIAHGGCAH